MLNDKEKDMKDNVVGAVKDRTTILPPLEFSPAPTIPSDQRETFRQTGRIASARSTPVQSHSPSEDIKDIKVLKSGRSTIADDTKKFMRETVRAASARSTPVQSSRERSPSRPSFNHRSPKDFALTRGVLF